MITADDWKRYKKNPIEFIREQYFIGRGKLIELEQWQIDDILYPLLMTKDADGRRIFNEALVGLPKKNGKTEIAAVLAFCDFFLTPNPETYFISNSKDQAASLAFDRFRRAITLNPALLIGLEIRASSIKNPISGGIAAILPHNSSTVAGKNPSYVNFDELWAFTHPESLKVFDELTISPARREPLNITTSYAGFSKSGPLYELYKRGQAGTDKRLFFYWSNENKASWVSPEYLEQQKKRMPRRVYERLHENKWTTGGGFLTEEMIDRAIDKGLKFGTIQGGTVGLDLGLRHDRTALARVVTGSDGARVLADLRTWQGRRGDEVQIAVVEKELVRQFADCGARSAYLDPWQLASSIQRLKGRVKIEEFSFTSASVCRLANCLYDEVANEQIKIPDDENLITELRELQLVETAAGWKFDHTATGHDDRAVALALAIYGEIQQPMPRPLDEILKEIVEVNAGAPMRVSCAPGLGIGQSFNPFYGIDRSEMDRW